MIKEVEIIVSGEVQGVGYRQYIAKTGRKLKLVGFAENLKDGTVRIHCKGDEKAISEFKKLINVQRPESAPLIDVENISETQLAEGTVKESVFEEKYSDSNAEMAQGFSTGMNYINLFRVESHANFNRMDGNLKVLGGKIDSGAAKTDENLKAIANKLDSGFEKTNESFKHMDAKYDKISEGMFAVVASMEKRMEKTDKNIESLLKILAQKKD